MTYAVYFTSVCVIGRHSELSSNRENSGQSFQSQISWNHSECKWISKSGQIVLYIVNNKTKSSFKRKKRGGIKEGKEGEGEEERREGKEEKYGCSLDLFFLFVYSEVLILVDSEIVRTCFWFSVPYWILPV